MDVSILIATKDASRELTRLLKAILPQIEQTGTEVIVVDASPDDSASRIMVDFPQATLMRRPPETLVPELWRDGLERSRGLQIMICSAHCVPASDWLSEARALLEGGCDGVAGTLDPAPSATAAQLALHFCRYARYMSPIAEHATWDLPGDAVAYRRESLFRFRELFSAGFWEPSVNHQMESAGCKLVLTPKLRATTTWKGPWADALAARYRHGRQYGLDRELSGPALGVHLFLWLLLPIVLLFRCMSRLQGKGVAWCAIICSLPWLLVFFSGWSLGEAAGYLEQVRRRLTS